MLGMTRRDSWNSRSEAKLMRYRGRCELRLLMSIARIAPDRISIFMWILEQPRNRALCVAVSDSHSFVSEFSGILVEFILVILFLGVGTKKRPSTKRIISDAVLVDGLPMGPADLGSPIYFNQQSRFTIKSQSRMTVTSAESYKL